MNRHHRPIRRWAHLGLLVAALLQFMGAAVGPWAHTRGHVASPEVAVCAPDDHGPHTPGTHDESSCGVWRVLTSPAIVPSGYGIPVAWTTSGGAGAERGVLAPASLPGASRARAPPITL